MPKAAQRQFLVTVSGIAGTFASKTGGEVTAEVSEAFDGGQLYPEKVAGPPIVGDLVIGRPYDPVRDQPVIKSLRPRVGRMRATVVSQPTDGDLVAVGQPDTYSNALLVSVTAPEHDAGSATIAMFELTFATETVV